MGSKWQRINIPGLKWARGGHIRPYELSFKDIFLLFFDCFFFRDMLDRFLQLFFARTPNKTIKDGNEIQNKREQCSWRAKGSKTHISFHFPLLSLHFNLTASISVGIFFVFCHMFFSFSSFFFEYQLVLQTMNFATGYEAGLPCISLALQLFEGLIRPWNGFLRALEGSQVRELVCTTDYQFVLQIAFRERRWAKKACERRAKGV